MNEGSKFLTSQGHEECSSSLGPEVLVGGTGSVDARLNGKHNCEHIGFPFDNSRPDGVHVSGTGIQILPFLPLLLTLHEGWLKLDYRHSVEQFHWLRLSYTVLVSVPSRTLQKESTYERSLLCWSEDSCVQLLE